MLRELGEWLLEGFVDLWRLC